MAGAALVLVLAGLLVPITLLFAALAFDAIIVAWMLVATWHDDVWPRVKVWNGQWYETLVRHRPHLRHHARPV